MTTASILDQRHRSRLLAVIIGALFPLAIALVATWLMASWLPELPDPIAIHWSGPTPDGYGPAVPMIFLPLGIVLAYSAFAVGVSWKLTPSGRPQWTQKVVLVTGVWLSSLLAIGIAGSVGMQRGLADAREAGGVGGALLWGAVVGCALAILAWFLLPKAGEPAMPDAQVESIALSETEQVGWFGTIRLAPVAIIVVAVALVLSFGATILTMMVAPQGVGIALASFVTILLLAVFTAFWKVTVDRRGLRAVGVLGWPRVVIGLDDVREVHAITVDPTADFGGWGWRWDGAGRSGLIMRRGAAIQVTRASGKRFVVTVDGAEAAASVLAALAASHRLK